MKLKQGFPFQDWIKNKSFQTNLLAENVSEDSFKIGAHLHTYHEILYIQKGKGQMMIDDKLYILEERTIYCIWQGQVHKWKEAQQRRGFAIMFKTDFLSVNDTTTFITSLFNRLQKVNAFRLQEEEIKLFNWLFELIYTEFQQPSYTLGQKQTIQHLTMTLLVKLARKNIAPNLETLTSLNTSLDIFQSFLLLLEHNYQSNAPLDFYAKQLGINLRKLNEIIKTYAGQTVKQVTTERTLTEAKRLLAHTNTAMKEIAYSLGFNNQAYFCYFFKKNIGISPQHYRKISNSE